MLRYLTQLIIVALVLTTPLSCTGDRCPDFRPVCSRARHIEEACAVVMAEQRVAYSRPSHNASPPVIAHIDEPLPELSDISKAKQFYLDSSHGRAPPLQPTASA